MLEQGLDGVAAEFAGRADDERGLGGGLGWGLGHGRAPLLSRTLSARRHIRNCGNVWIRYTFSYDLADWDLYPAFLAVIDAGSLSGAARALKLTQPTIGRQIETLERSLGEVVLFTRSPGGLRPTDAALALKPHAEAMASAAEALLRTASGEADQMRGVVRVTASTCMGAESAAHPDRLPRGASRSDDRTRALQPAGGPASARRPDIAVRTARTDPVGVLTARRYAQSPSGLLAHRRYLQRHGEPATFADAAHSSIGFDRNLDLVDAVKALDLPLRRETFAFRSDSDHAQLAALRAGFGVGACQHGIARRDPNLVPVLEGEFRFDLEVWVAMHEDLKAIKRMRLMFDWLYEGVRAYVAGIADRLGRTAGNRRLRDRFVREHLAEHSATRFATHAAGMPTRCRTASRASA